MTSSHITLRKMSGRKSLDRVVRVGEEERKKVTKHETEKSNNCLLDKDQCCVNNLCVSLWLDGLIIPGAKAMHETHRKKIGIKRCLIVKNAGKTNKYKTISFLSFSFVVLGFYFWVFRFLRDIKAIKLTNDRPSFSSNIS